MIVRSTVRRSAYYDSATLMQAQQALRALPGIAEAGVVMGTEANLDLLRQAGLDPGGLAATPDALVVAVRGDTEAHVEAALASLDMRLARPPAAAGSLDAEYRPRTVSTAARLLPGANLALISVPGRFAAGVARDALVAGLHVMLFSDNVPLKDEVQVKQLGRARGRLVMGPDCGTAIIGGAALGFANRVRRGPVGIVAAAGTGLQEVATVIHRQGGGISHAIGTGGRDLTTAVGGVTMSRGLAALGRDPATTVVVLVSKPPDPDVAGRLLAEAGGLGKPVVVAFVGGRPEGTAGGTLYAAGTLEEAGVLALRLAGGAPRDSGDADRRWREEAARRARAAIARLARPQRYLRGLFSGGTLCTEAVALLGNWLRPLSSNVPVGAAERHEGAGPSRAHTVLDLGDDLFTVGRLHPMLDMTLRIQRLAQEAADSEVAVLLLDVVLGQGVHPDPAGALVPAIVAAGDAAAKAGRHLAVVASVCGTDEDPQHRGRQVERLEAAGILVEETNARAALLAGMIAARKTDVTAVAVRVAEPAPAGASRAGETPIARPARAATPQPGGAEIEAGAGGSARSSQGDDAFLAGPPRVVNVGLAIFAESLRAQEVPVIDVEWRPPAGGDREMMDLLERLR